MASTDIIDRVAKVTRAIITSQCSTELHHPYTQNLDFSSSKEKRLRELRKQHRSLLSTSERNTNSPSPKSVGSSNFQLPPVVNGQQTQPLTKSESNGVGKISDQDLLYTLSEKGYRLENGLNDLDRLHPPAKFDGALDVIATVLTYFDIACSRMIDVIPMIIQHEFLYMFGLELRNTLLKELGLIGENSLEKCKEYAVDDPQIESERKDLEAKMKILKNASNILDQF